MSNANVAFIQSLYAAFGRGEIATIIAALAPDVDWTITGRREDYPLMGVWKGQAGVQEFFTSIPKYQDFTEFSPREFLADGDRVVVLGHYAATIKTNGAKMASDWCHVFTIRGGKIAAFREFTDTAGFVRAYRG